MFEDELRSAIYAARAAAFIRARLNTVLHGLTPAARTSLEDVALGGVVDHLGGRAAPPLPTASKPRGWWGRPRYTIQMLDACDNAPEGEEDC